MKRAKLQKKFSEQFSKLFGHYPPRRIEPRILLLAFVVSVIIWQHVKRERAAEDENAPVAPSTDANLP